MDYEYESIELPAVLADAVTEAREAALLAAGGGIALDETEPAWEPVGATFDLRSGEERDVPFEGGPAGPRRGAAHRG